MASPLCTSLSKTSINLFNKIPSYSRTFLFIFFLFILAFFTFNSPLFHPSKTLKNPPLNNHFHGNFLSFSSNSTLSYFLRALTRHPHLAGTPQGHRTAEFVRTHFESLGFESRVSDYKVLLSYPVKSSLFARFDQMGVREFGLSEVGRAGFEPVQPYHAYAPSGAVVGAAVFVNYGRKGDYSELRGLGVNVSGCVVIVRRSEMSRSTVVEAAVANGAAAVLMYTEVEVFRGGVERGTVMDGLGDPLSPGWASVAAGGERLEREDGEVVKRFGGVPSMPLSMETAEVILSSLDGPKVPEKWRESLKTKVWRVGPGPTVLNFTYQGEEKLVMIRDVFAVIRGSEEPDSFVLLGNHRDAWTYGAVDPNSGTAALLDIARRFSYLSRLGWRPHRTIILCSWDAEEFGMIGSTEWVEQNIMNLGSRAVAYLNVDCAVQGPGLFARATPQLDDLLVEVTKKVKDPDKVDATVYDQWMNMNKGINIERLNGVDSDYAAFLQHAGVPSLDMYYGKDFPVYHTAFDSYDWMVKYGDPFFHRHVAVTELWGLLALRLADDPVLPFNYLNYAAQLQAYINDLSVMLEADVSLDPLSAAVQQLSDAAKRVNEEAKELRADGPVDDPAVMKKRMLNDRLMRAERGLLNTDGLLGNPWFKHLVYGPRSDSESKLKVFPSIANAISQSKSMKPREKQAPIQHEIWRLSRSIQRAANALMGELLFSPTP